MLKVLPQLDAIIKAKPEDTDFWGPITRMPADFSDAEKQRLTEAYRSMIGERVMPAYQRLRDFIASDYLPACRDPLPLSALTAGEACYPFPVTPPTTNPLTPPTAHP